jgi:hypothetical protein
LKSRTPGKPFRSLPISYHDHGSGLVFFRNLMGYCGPWHCYAKIVNFHIISLTLMNPNNRINQGNNRRTKATAAIPMAGAIVTAALLLSGLSLITSYQPVIAQQNMTGTNATAANATGATTGNQTAAGNQTGTSATTGGNNTAGIAGGRGTTAGGPIAGQGEGSGGGAASYGGNNSQPIRARH